MKRIFLFLSSILLLLTACSERPLNNPYPRHDDKANIYYASFAEQPKTLDPARSYSSNEAVFTGQIYEPPLQYHYLKRPYTLITQLATALPEAVYYDKNNQRLADNAATKDIAYTIYTIHIRPNIFYQPHPAFAETRRGNYYYYPLHWWQLLGVGKVSDFKHLGTREVTAADFVYEIKRLASPNLQSPILGLMSKYIVGLESFSERLQKLPSDKSAEIFKKLRSENLEGAQVIDRYTYQIKINGKYSQFIYWLAMVFFAPVPWEADQFYAQPGMKAHNLTLDWYPVGTGPYRLMENNPNRRMILERNPNYHGDYYPTEGTAEDRANGLLIDAGKALPFMDKIIFTLETESIPRWTKFLQGYYDSSAISSDSFDQAIRVDENGEMQLTDEMKNKGIHLQSSISTSSYYLGFNMLDDVVGGKSENNRKLRIALSIVMDYEDFITIFLNGRGLAAQGPLPPGIFGHEDGKLGINPYVYSWEDNKPHRLRLEVAKKLLAEAGYPNGRDAKTGEQLILNYDSVSSGGPEDKAYLDWMRKQFAKLGIELQIRSTTYNRFQEKLRTGNIQLYSLGWNADYPDPENFLFLLYGANGKVKFGGENASNYQNSEYDKLFLTMKDLPNGAERQQVINKMISIAQHDAPWMWGYNPLNFTLEQQWVTPIKPNDLANNILKYVKIDPTLREKLRNEWNKPIWWPIDLMILFLVVVLIPVGVKYFQREYMTKERYKE